MPKFQLRLVAVLSTAFALLLSPVDTNAADKEKKPASKKTPKKKKKPIPPTVVFENPNPDFKPAPGFTALFNGKNLDGWDSQPGTWEVRNGVINCTGVAKARNWLIYRGKEFGDFELRLKFIWAHGNSGVQVRSKDIGEWQVRGYQVEVSETKGMGLWHHSLASGDPKTKHRSHLAIAGQKVKIGKNGKKDVKQVADADKVKAAYKEKEWNDLTVICRGTRLIQKINGVEFSDLRDAEATHSSLSGVLALQDHGKGANVAFTDIQIREFKP